VAPDVAYHPVIGLNGRFVYILKLSLGSFQGPQGAQGILEKARSALRGGDYVPDIVIMQGEATENPAFFGPYETTSYIRSILPTLSNITWYPAVLD
jgi:hypothetical protein